MIRRLLLAAAVASALTGCATPVPHKRAPQRNTPRMRRMVAARNARVTMRLRVERDAHNRAFFDARVAQARGLAGAGAYEAAFFVLSDARHFAAMTFGAPRGVESIEAKPRAFTQMRLGVMSYDRKQYALAKAQWRDALAHVATQRASRRRPLDTKHTLDLLRAGGDFDGGPTPAQDEAMHQLILTPNPRAPKRRHRFLFFKW